VEGKDRAAEGKALAVEGKALAAEGKALVAAEGRVVAGSLGGNKAERGRPQAQAALPPDW
jgi:hypothetical protein